MKKKSEEVMSFQILGMNSTIELFELEILIV
jgi:hypothetical protein